MRLNRESSALILFAALVIIFYILPVSSERLKAGGNLRIFSREGILLRQFNSPSDGAYSIWLNVGEIPGHVKDAVLTAEDSRFYFHPGFDPLAMARAAWQNIAAMRVVSGGSTITQQTARIVYADVLPRNILLKKISEILLAIKLELHCSKDEILELYLNRVPMKFNQRGLPAASVRVFGRDIRFISREEAGALVVIIRQNYASRENFRLRYSSFMKRMWGMESADISVIESALFREGGYFYNDPESGTAHFEVFISAMAGDVCGDLRTPISANLNDAVAGIIRAELKFLSPHNVENSAVIVLKLPENDNGRVELAAMVGSADFTEESSGQVNGCLAVRSAGSTLKPLLYGMAMDTGEYAPWSVINDIPITVGLEDGTSYSPKNNDLKFWGPITIREALACSRNIPAVYMVNRLGVNNFYRFLIKSGFGHMDKPPDYYGPGLALGGGGASLLQLCRAYSAIAMRGRLLPIYMGSDMRGNDVYYGEGARLFTEKSAYRLTHILSDREARRRAFGSRNFLDFPYDVAVKTGTSKDFRDAWTIGYTDRYVVGVWVGNFSGKMMKGVSGGWGAGRIFHQVVRTLTGRERPVFRYPERYSLTRMCPVSGRPAGRYCRYTMELTDYADRLGRSCDLCTSGSGSSRLYSSGSDPEVISPVNGETYIIDPDLPARDQDIPLKVLPGRERTAAYTCRIDGKQSIPLDKPLERTIPAKRGEHSIEIYRDDELLRTIIFRVE